MQADTIVAIATAPGSAGVGVIRLSGPRAVDAVARVFRPADGRVLPLQPARHLAFGRLVDGQGSLLDEALVVRFAAPASFTGEDVVEIQAHGGTYILRSIQDALLERGRDLLPPLRLARPGEFTQRAFLNGKLDLTQAEAVADLIHSGSSLAREAAARQLAGSLQGVVEGLCQGVLGLLAEAEAACDFPEEAGQLAGRAAWVTTVSALRGRMGGLLGTAHTGRMLTQGVRVCLAGAPNAGKSSLLNALAGEERAIVSPEPGTTRDWLELRYQVQGMPVLLYDTAGLREAQGAVEAEGVRRTRRWAAEADLLLLLLDQTAPFEPAWLDLLREVATPALLVLTKSDLDPVWDSGALRGALKPRRPEWMGDGLSRRMLSVSAKQGSGLEALQSAILDTALGGRAAQAMESVLLTQARHEAAMRAAFEALGLVEASLAAGGGPELLAVDLRSALDSLGEIVGLTTRAEVLEQIFARFCIGK